jgi:catechol 2,3-dioxygenase-like lactoylglutathione lyase family enzyme
MTTSSKLIIGQIDCVYLPVINQDETINWYREKLGVKWTGFSFNFGNGPEIMLVTVKNIEDVKLTYKTDHWEGEDYDMHLLTFKSENIEETYEALKERGVNVTEIKLYDGNRKNFRFYDLNGNRFDVWSGWL